MTEGKQDAERHPAFLVQYAPERSRIQKRKGTMKIDRTAIRCNSSFLRHTERIFSFARPDAEAIIKHCIDTEKNPAKRTIIISEESTCLVQYVIGLGVMVAGWKPDEEECPNLIEGRETISYYDDDEEWWAVYDADTRPYLEKDFEDGDYLVWNPETGKFFLRTVREVKWHCEVPDFDDDLIRDDEPPHISASPDDSTQEEEFISDDCPF